MKRSQRLGQLLTLAMRDVELMGGQYRQAMQLLAQAEGKLNQLREYREEYSQRVRDGQGRRVDLAQVQEARQFLCRLADAEQTQTQEVARQRGLVQIAEQAWIDGRQRCRSLEDLIARYRTQEHELLERAEQARTDDLAGQRHVWLARELQREQ